MRVCFSPFICSIEYTVCRIVYHGSVVGDDSSQDSWLLDNSKRFRTRRPVIARDSKRDCLNNRTTCYLIDSERCSVSHSRSQRLELGFDQHLTPIRLYAKVYYYCPQPKVKLIFLVMDGWMKEDDSCYINRIYHRGVSESANQHETVTTTIQTGITEKCTSS